MPENFAPGDLVIWNGKRGRVLPPSPLDYECFHVWPDGTKERSVEVKFLDEIGGGILAPSELEKIHVEGEDGRDKP
jgi:hypothetical protein